MYYPHACVYRDMGNLVTLVNEPIMAEPITVDVWNGDVMNTLELRFQFITIDDGLYDSVWTSLRDILKTHNIVLSPITKHMQAVAIISRSSYKAIQEDINKESSLKVTWKSKTTLT